MNNEFKVGDIVMNISGFHGGPMMIKSLGNDERGYYAIVDCDTGCRESISDLRLATNEEVAQYHKELHE